MGSKSSLQQMANTNSEDLSNASLDFGECYDFRDTFVESWHVFYRDEPGENADLTVVHEEWRDKS